MPAARLEGGEVPGGLIYQIRLWEASACGESLQTSGGGKLPGVNASSGRQVPAARLEGGGAGRLGQGMLCLQGQEMTVLVFCGGMRCGGMD